MSFAMAPFAKLIAKIQARVSPLAQPGGTKHAVSPALAHRGSKGAHRFTIAGVFRGGPEFESLQHPQTTPTSQQNFSAASFRSGSDAYSKITPGI
jgi:hypothetical protein